MYMPPAGGSARVNEMVVCNRGAVLSSFRVSISQSGAATANKDYLYYDLIIIPKDTFASDIGLTLRPNETMRVYAANGNLTFTLIGVVT